MPVKSNNIIIARVFSVYFDREPLDSSTVEKYYDCKVVALNAEEALAKAKQAFPAEIISSVFEPDASFHRSKAGPVVI